MFSRTIQNLVNSLQASLEDSLINNVLGTFFIGVIKVLEIAQTEVGATCDSTTANTLKVNAKFLKDLFKAYKKLVGHFKENLEDIFKLGEDMIPVIKLLPDIDFATVLGGSLTKTFYANGLNGKFMKNECIATVENFFLFII